MATSKSITGEGGEETKTVDESTGSPSQDNVLSKDEQRVRSEIDSARAIQKQQVAAVRARKKLSSAVRVRTVVDPRKELVRLYVKNPAKMAACFAPVDKKNIMVGRGYEPVLADGKYVNHDGDLLFVRPREITAAELREADEVSKERLKSKNQDAKAARVSEDIKFEKDID